MAALPTHETLPADHKAAIRQMKQALRAQIGDVQAVFDNKDLKGEAVEVNVVGKGKVLYSETVKLK